LGTDKKNFETKKPDGRKLFASFSVYFRRLLIALYWSAGLAIYLWLCWWVIDFLNSLVS